MVDFTGWRILVVDDEPDNCGVLELVFRFHNADVHIAESAAACMELMSSDFTPSLIMMDIQMPGMSGYQLLESVRSHAEWKHAPVIAVTAHVMRDDKQKALLAGFDGYIPKPISAMTIAAEVSDILNSKSQRTT
jgi:two-component system cell cycle response regulator DivK